MDKKNSKKKYKNKKLSRTVSIRKLYKYHRALVLSSEENVTNEYNRICEKYPIDPVIIPVKKRIVVFGDIHGDYKLAIELILLSKIAKIIGYKYLDEKDNIIDKNVDYSNIHEILDIPIDDKIEYIFEWTGEDTYVVQIGDQIDRCRPYDDKLCNDPETMKDDDEDSDIKILDLFTELNIQAHKHNGAVISLFGNHELLNNLGVIDYVSYKNLQHFNGENGRINAFKAGHEYGTKLGCSRSICVIIGTHIFVHAGIIDKLIKQLNIGGVADLDKINMLIKKWLLGLIDKKLIIDLVRSDDSMFWTRMLGSLEPSLKFDDPLCSDNISKVFELFKINGMIIGHTPQAFVHNKEINSTCSNKVWRVDIGSSSAFDIFDLLFKDGNKSYNRRAQYLEIIDDEKYLICDKDGCKKSS
jgi:hypothetical protein